MTGIRLALVFVVFLCSLAVRADSSDSISDIALREVVVKSSKPRVLHMVALVRDVSTLSTYTDTVVMYREKWVDFMIPDKPSKGFPGWRAPRILAAKSYYQFRNSLGLDSVSDRCNQHFSWSDWISVIDRMPIPLAADGSLVDSVFGRYGASEVWSRRPNGIDVKIDVLADTLSAKWVPGLAPFLKRENFDYENFKIEYHFADPEATQLLARDLHYISCGIESRGRGADMFKFNRRGEPFFVTTHTNIYPLEKVYLSSSDAKKWIKFAYASEELDRTLPPGSVPALPDHLTDLVARVNAIDHDAIRLAIKPDDDLYSNHRKPLTNAQVIKKILGNMLGL